MIRSNIFEFKFQLCKCQIDSKREMWSAEARENINNTNNVALKTNASEHVLNCWGIAYLHILCVYDRDGRRFSNVQMWEIFYRGFR